MSAYFDADAGAVQELVRALGCERLQIAVGPKSKVTNFPVSNAGKWASKIDAVWSTEADEKRALVHAKWIEVHDGEISAVLTGSVNATRKALCSTDNVEVGVLRIKPKRIQWTNWINADFPKRFEPCDFSANRSGELVAFATAHSDGSIWGRIIGFAEQPGTYDATLTRSTGESVSFDVAVKADGSFNKLPRIRGSFLLAAGLQITLRRAGIIARGWLHVEGVLSLPRLPKLNIPSFLRMLRREHTEDDEIALLDYFAVDATRHSALFSEPIGKAKGTKTTSDPDDLDLVIDLAEIKPDPSRQIEVTSEAEGLGLASGSLKRLFSRLRHLFLAPSAQEGTTRPQASRMPVEVEGEGEAEPLPEETHVESAIETFDSRMRELIEAEQLSSKARRGLYVLWFEVLEYMKSVRSEDSDDAFAFMRERTGLVGTGMRALEKIDALEQHLVTCLATMSLLLADSSPQLNSDFHDTLEHFYSAEVPSERTHKALLVGSIVPYRLILKEENGERLKAGLDRILAAPTLRQQLELFIEKFQKSGAIDEGCPLFHGSAGRKIVDRLLSSPSQVNFVDLLDERPVCPKCFISLPTSMAQHLSRSRIACCECGSVIVRRMP
jgi:hypothetical protein